MNMQSSKILSLVNNEGIINLSAELKNILVPDYKKTDNRNLSSAELWNIQRNKRVRRNRRYM
ncbi:MAG TPA: hypothetical protein PK987_01385 [Ferruginibacter sp.]|nr:hypothetical protein [Ferruginibacter sp.]